MSEFSETAFKWFEKALSDLEHAQLSHENKDYDWATLAAQQAAEKAFKAVYINHGLGLVKTHELTSLARKLKAPINVIEKAALLNPFYSASRYPDVDEPLDEAESKQASKDALKAASEVLDWCEKRIKT